MPLFARLSFVALGLSLMAAPTAYAQVVSGVLTVTGAEMH
jgi:hypothetical protein